MAPGGGGNSEWGRASESLDEDLVFNNFSNILEEYIEPC
jgi:hypothetical protein